MKHSAASPGAAAVATVVTVTHLITKSMEQSKSPASHRYNTSICRNARGERQDVYSNERLRCRPEWVFQMRGG
jgi:hypothetical protein